MAERALAVASALCVVAAFALATLWPVLTTLDEWLAATDQDLLIWLHHAVRAALPAWAWRGLLAPLLGRPCWLLPLTLGLLLGGTALSVASRRSVADSPRWRD